MILQDGQFEVRLARGEEEIHAAQRLRYEVFVAELGGDGALVDHAARRERDVFDASYTHLLAIDTARPERPVVATCRLMHSSGLPPDARFYTENEYDIGVLRASGRPLLELGRSCVHRAYRGGPALMALWRGLMAEAEARGTEVLFGVASFHGTDATALAGPLSLLHHRHRAPEALRVRARADNFQPMNLLPEAEIDRVAAMKAMPPLLKSYLRLGGVVGEGAWLDHAFNCTDVCVVVDVEQVPEQLRRFYAGARGGAGRP
ncbi:MAG: GNAT family N-acetyltransferase [Alphaproteobacteria bacterium]|nr:MAG: GNAT family N-acetyltransferase [Alphaproteobacteria bacterium]